MEGVAGPNQQKADFGSREAHPFLRIFFENCLSGRGKKSKKGEGCLAIREPQSGQKSAFRRVYNGSWKPQFFNISANLSPAAHLLIFTSDFGLPGTRMGARNS
jgi:hypothetical protein